MWIRVIRFVSCQSAVAELLRNLIETPHTESPIAMTHVERVRARYNNSDNIQPELGDIGRCEFHSQRFETGCNGLIY